MNCMVVLTHCLFFIAKDSTWIFQVLNLVLIYNLYVMSFQISIRLDKSIYKV